jgi:uncharacterized membrane protein
MPGSSSADPASSRFNRLDALRGIAIVWMAVFHFSFDLSHFGYTQQDFYRDPVWTLQRVCIVSLFLFCSGLSLAVALDRGQTWPRFWRRWAQIAGAAVLVSFGSWLMFPRSFIFFGVLHGIALMLVLLRLAAPLGHGLWLLALVAIALPRFLAHPFFDSRLTGWVGLVTHKPITEDYVPLLPWIGVMALGLVAGQWVLRARPGWLAGAVPAAVRPLASLGRWSLSFYLLHQPVLIGLLLAWAVLRR